MSSAADNRLSPVPPLPSDVRALLEVERSGEHAIPGDSEARLRRRVEMSVGVVALSVGTVSAVAATGTAAKVVAKPWIVALLAFVVGGLTGAGVHAFFQPRQGTTVMPTTVASTVTTVYVEKTVTVPVAAAPTAPMPPTTPTTPTTNEATTSVAEGVSSAAQGGKASPSTAAAAPSGLGDDTGLAAERSLLEVARTALSRGDFASAMTSLDAHQKKFPNGVLREEREALYVQALARAGRRDEAKARAERFVKTYPKSMLLPVVEAATE